MVWNEFGHPATSVPSAWYTYMCAVALNVIPSAGHVGVLAAHDDFRLAVAVDVGDGRVRVELAIVDRV